MLVMEEVLRENEKNINIKVGKWAFSFPKDYSNLSIEELNSYTEKHKFLPREITKSSMDLPDKKSIIVAHMNNLGELVRAYKKYCLDVSAIMLAKEIEKEYEPILREIGKERKIREERRKWTWWE